MVFANQSCRIRHFEGRILTHLQADRERAVVGEAVESVHLAHDCAMRLSFAIEFRASDADIQSAGNAFDEKAAAAAAALREQTIRVQVLNWTPLANELHNLQKIFSSVQRETTALFQRRAKLDEQQMKLALEQLGTRWRVEIDNAVDLCIKAARSNPRV